MNKRIKVITRKASSKEIKEDCQKWAEDIKIQYEPDLIVFIAKSGFLFAKPMAEVLGCEMVDIAAKRPKSETKDGIRKWVKYIPESVVMKIISSPLSYYFNASKKDRDIEISKRFLEQLNRNHSKILIVDDSVDTGWTLLQVKEKVQSYFPQAEVKTASYVVIDYSKGRVDVDFFRHKNQIVLTATSRKSEEYDIFLKEYNTWKTVKNESL